METSRIGRPPRPSRPSDERKDPPTDTKWSIEFDTVRREKLFRAPPVDHSAYPHLKEAVRPHIDSFNTIMGDENEEDPILRDQNGKKSILHEGIKDIGTRTFVEPPETDGQRLSREKRGDPPPSQNKLHVKISKVTLGKCMTLDKRRHVYRREIYPSECRESHTTYRGRLYANIQYRVNEGDWQEFTRDFGYLPLMLRSNRCHLEKSSPAHLAYWKEETEEQGGYFIVNGNERLIRMLIVNKRNYPLAIIRPSFASRGPSYTKYGVQIRCTRPDQTSQSIWLHYLSDGNITFRFSWRKNEYLVPVMMVLKALVETNDREIFENLVGKAGSLGASNTFVSERVELLLRAYKVYNLHGKTKTRAYLGDKFKPVLDIPNTTSNLDAGTEFLRRVVLVHLGNFNVTETQDRDKFHLLLFMIRKLYSLVAGDCRPDNPDAASSQEILLGGTLYGMILKEKFEEWIQSIRYALRQWSESSKDTYHTFTSEAFRHNWQSKILARSSDQIGAALEYFLSTGNLSSQSGLDLQQISGFTIIAEKINFYRFLSHFRCVHRGAFFAQLKTTTVRKLLPESWGFLCPVHTPDGSPCGLLNHFAHQCQITTVESDVTGIPNLLASIGLSAPPSASPKESLAVLLNGRIVGFCTPEEAQVIADTLRYLKVEGNHGIPRELEVGLVSEANGGLFPGLYLFSGPARMLRPVKYLPLDAMDLIGPFEQQYMSVALNDQQIVSGESSHVEYDVRNILSIFANQTPFSDHNQSPRNMYQCQMAKQTMGTPGTSLRYRTDNKAYRLTTGQTPIARAPLYNAYGLDHFPNGTNAIVAVISYTGYDMDDAMILNKMAHERGFGHGSIYKTKIIRLNEETKTNRSKSGVKQLFGFPDDTMKTAGLSKYIDRDGLPFIGTRLTESDPLCVSHAVIYDAASDSLISRGERPNVHRYKDAEVAYVEDVRLIGQENAEMPCQAISIKLRIPRAAVIGDKFSSRHGQKGVCSQQWPAADLPFSETGIVPDVIINPHAFPSRMTIGMFIESLAGKAGALHGLAQDSSPWRFNEQHPAADFFGDQLKAAGFNYHGNEPMYSGITGEVFPADIYFGVVFYQRLRHMVADKFQVRTTGPVNPTTGQPIKGRAKGGGIRVGEMERDALLAHGAAYLLADRLLHCSDYTRAWICRSCGSFLSTQPAVQHVRGAKRPAASRADGGGGGAVRCRNCAVRLETAGRTRPSSIKAAMGPVRGPSGSKNAPGEQQGMTEDEQREEKARRKEIERREKAGEETWRDAAGTKWLGGADTTVVAVPGVLKFLDAELGAMGVRMRFNVGP